MIKVARRENTQQRILKICPSQKTQTCYIALIFIDYLEFVSEPANLNYLIGVCINLAKYLDVSVDIYLRKRDAPQKEMLEERFKENLFLLNFHSSNLLRALKC